MWYNRTLFNYYYPVLNSVRAVIAIFKLGAAVNFYIVTYIVVFVDNSIFDVASVAYAHNWRIGCIGFLNLFKRLVVSGGH